MEFNTKGTELNYMKWIDELGKGAISREKVELNMNQQIT